MFTPISVSLSPNVFPKDVLEALKLLLSPRKWLRGNKVAGLEKDFTKLFPEFETISFLSGRTALLAILKALGIGEGDEVACQSFTCVVVPNSILETGAKPVFVDIEKSSFNLSPADLTRKVTPRTRAIIVQHTFGFPAQIKKILALARQHHLFVIEDCAHGIAVSLKGKKLGTFGDAAFFSFGRDKVLSSVFGGLAITRKRSLAQKIRSFQKELPHPTAFWVIRQLLHPLLFAVILPLYNFLSLGKVILVSSQRFGLLSFPVQKKEKGGCFDKNLLARLPNSLASLAKSQLKRLDRFNQVRCEHVAFYAQRLANLPLKLPCYQSPEGETFPLLRFTIQVDKPQALYEFAKKRGVILNNWYYPAISPRGVLYEAIGYDPATCPIAEKVSFQVLNLPTHPRMTLKKTAKVVEVIEDFFR
jgi:dTDP-4-amino-4,6-dideoxygalactose transaminase